MKNNTPKTELTKLSGSIPTIQDQKEKFAPLLKTVAERAEKIDPEYAAAQQLTKKAKLPAPSPFSDPSNPTTNK